MSTLEPKNSRPAEDRFCDLDVRLDLARRIGRFDLAGIDGVNRAVNFALVQGELPSRVYLEIHWPANDTNAREDFLLGVDRACRAHALVLEIITSGESESPDVRIAACGPVADAKVTTREQVSEGDAIVGILAPGIQGAGLDLVIDLLLDRLRWPLDAAMPSGESTLRDWFYIQEKTYDSVLHDSLLNGWLHALSVVTASKIGGARSGLGVAAGEVCTPNLCAHLQLGSWPVPSAFLQLARAGSFDDRAMSEAFGLGLGMLAVVSPEKLTTFTKWLTAWNKPHWVIGRMENAVTRSAAAHEGKLTYTG